MNSADTKLSGTRKAQANENYSLRKDRKFLVMEEGRLVERHRADKNSNTGLDLIMGVRVVCVPASI